LQVSLEMAIKQFLYSDLVAYLRNVPVNSNQAIAYNDLITSIDNHFINTNQLISYSDLIAYLRTIPITTNNQIAYNDLETDIAGFFRNGNQAISYSDLVAYLRSASSINANQNIAYSDTGLRHRGREAPLFFWRDSTGHEVDILMDLGDRLVPVEVKSGQTVAADATDNLIWWTNLARSHGGLVVRGHHSTLPARNLDPAVVHSLTEDLRLRGRAYRPPAHARRPRRGRRSGVP